MAEHDIESETADTLPPALEPSSNALRVTVTEGELPAGEHPVHHICHLGGGWFELRTGPDATAARVRLSRADVQPLHAAGFITNADLAALQK